jgi:hypothetical protein
MQTLHANSKLRNFPSKVQQTKISTIKAKGKNTIAAIARCFKISAQSPGPAPTKEISSNVHHSKGSSCQAKKA